MRKLELLAPARDLACGMAAIDHGADAVYIGASRYGARAAVGNSVADIKALCDYAHRFEAKVYVTVNTIVYEHEKADTLSLISQLQEAGADALLVQDMGVATHAQMPLHASTQCDVRSPEKVKWLQQMGFNRVVLARELSLEEIQDIHKAVPDVELEVFVHGALCVSYSGVCYASQHCFNRSANRGECAQFCRLKFDLLDADGKEIVHQRHLLSLKDLCQIDALEALADAGACSFKIEGRLKDISYVKNVVAAYSQRLDELIRRRPKEFVRASRGSVSYSFSPNLNKTFNRGYTHYFLKGRQPDIACFDTPKAMGEYVGKVKEIRGKSFTVAGIAEFANGDGLCFINKARELEGFRVNRVEGNRLFPQHLPANLRSGMALYRNNDVTFDKILAAPTADRRIPLTMTLGLTDSGFRLSAAGASCEVEFEHQPARNGQYDNIVAQLSKMGNTLYVCDKVTIEDDADRYFIPSSLLSRMRRDLVAKLDSLSTDTVHPQSGPMQPMPMPQGWQREYVQYPYLFNIANSWANDFYGTAGLRHREDAFELSSRPKGLIMQCRHCLRYALGYCVRRGGKQPQWREPLSLRIADGRRFTLRFMCDECQMNIYAED